jgi:DNA-binding MarR family transcriptional regulator
MPPRGDKITPHEISVLKILRNSPRCWFSNRDLLDAVKVTGRCIRHHTAAWLKLGLVERVAAFPGSKFRLKLNPTPEAKEYLRRVDQMVEVYGG